MERCQGKRKEVRNKRGMTSRKKVTWPVDDPSNVQLGRLSALLFAASTFFLSSVLVFERVLPAASILENKSTDYDRIGIIRMGR